MFRRIVQRSVIQNLVNMPKLSVQSSLNSPLQKFSRALHISSLRYSDETNKKPRNINVTFVLANGDKLHGKGRKGDHFLDVVIDNDLDIDGYGACEGTCACSSCHIIFSEADFKKIKSPASDEEMDMLDLAFDLTDTSRLGCQVFLTEDMDGIVVQVPETINDARLT